MGDNFPNAREVVVTGGTFQANKVELHHTHGASTEMDLLLGNCTLAALFDANEPADQPKCDPDTRLAIINDMINWVTTDDLGEYITSMLWLHGPAGAGKTALGKTIAEMCRKSQRLLGSFFFSRTMAGRSDGSTLIPTLAYQLMLSLPSTRGDILNYIKQDPGIFKQDMATQLEQLIVKPLNRFLCVISYTIKDYLGWKQPRLFVIDGLDECADSDIQCKVLQVISDAMDHFHLPVRFMIASRPEAHITRLMDKNNFSRRIHFQQINLAFDPNADCDIRVFLCNQFDEIRKKHPEVGAWPPKADIEQLVRKASRQFIYAKAVVDYINTEHHAPNERLQIVLGLSPPPLDDSPFAQLDELYRHILSSVPNRTATMEIISILIILTTPENSRLSGYTSPIMLERLLDLKPGDVRRRLVGVLSLFTVAAPEVPIKILHASLPDFLFDWPRSREFFVELCQWRWALARGYLQAISDFELGDKERPDVIWTDILYPALTNCRAVGSRSDLYCLWEELDIVRLYSNCMSHCPWKATIVDSILNDITQYLNVVAPLSAKTHDYWMGISAFWEQFPVEHRLPWRSSFSEKKLFLEKRNTLELLPLEDIFILSGGSVSTHEISMLIFPDTRRPNLATFAMKHRGRDSEGSRMDNAIFLFIAKSHKELRRMKSIFGLSNGGLTEHGAGEQPDTIVKIFHLPRVMNHQQRNLESLYSDTGLPIRRNANCHHAWSAIGKKVFRDI